MKSLKALFSISILIAALGLPLFAQQPPAGAPGAPGAAAGGRGGGGGQRGGARGGGGRGGERGGRAPTPVATGPVADATNALITAINTQDSTFFRSAMTTETILVDEDGHVGNPAAVWAMRLASPSRKMAISNLMVGDLGDSGAWAAFNYTLTETNPQGQATPIQGSGTIVYSKSGTDLKPVVIQFSVNGRAITPHTGQP